VSGWCQYTVSKEKIIMPQYSVGLVSNDPKVLPELSDRLQEPWSTIIEKEEGIYYWSSSLFDDLATVIEVDECASRLLATLNGLVKLYSTDAGELVKAGKIKFVNQQGREVTQISLSVPARAVLTFHEDEEVQREAKQRWLNISEISIEENENSPISHALNYFGKEANWDNLFKVFEVIQKDYNNSQGISRPGDFIPLPEEWTRDENSRNREKDFTESANNAYVSGIFARHSLARSERVVSVADSSLWLLVYTKKEILPMTLERAKIFVADLLSHWIIERKR
jgi:hypothetical protein